MTIKSSDILKLPFTPDLTEGGIAFSTRFHAQGFEYTSGSHYARLRNIVSSAAIELAFRRYLNENQIPFEIKSAQPFSQPNRYDVSLGGHRCLIQSELISSRAKISEIRRQPELILERLARVPEELFSPDNSGAKTLHLFSLLLGLSTISLTDTQKAIAAGQPTYLIHALPIEWSHPSIWASLGHLTLKNEANTPLDVELSGLDEKRNFISETLTIAPLERISPLNNYYSLAFIHVNHLPEARLGIHSSIKEKTHIISHREWENIWIYGLEIWLAGYLSQDEFRRNAQTTFTGSRVFQYSQSTTKELAVHFSALRPLNNLFTQVKAWEQNKQSGKIY